MPVKRWALSSSKIAHASPGCPALGSFATKSTAQQRLVPGAATLGGFRKAISHPRRDPKKIVAALNEVGEPITHFGKCFRILLRNRGYPDPSQNHARGPLFLQKHRGSNACRTAHQRHFPVF